MLRFISAVVLGFIALGVNLTEAQAGNCSAYESCGYKGAKYDTCDQYNACLDRERAAADAKREKEKPGPGANGQNKDAPEHSKSTRGAAPAK